MPKKEGFTVIERNESGNVTDRSQTSSPSSSQNDKQQLTTHASSTVCNNLSNSHKNIDIPQIIITPPPLPPRDDDCDTEYDMLEPDEYLDEKDFSEEIRKTSQSPILSNPFYKTNSDLTALKREEMDYDKNVYAYFNQQQHSKDSQDYYMSKAHSKARNTEGEYYMRGTRDLADSESSFSNPAEDGCKMEFVNFLDLADFVSHMNLRLSMLEHKLEKEKQEKQELEERQRVESERRKENSFKRRFISCFSWIPCMSKSRK